MLHTARRELKLFALVDFDPYGVAIMRTYKHGSQRLNHEENATVPGLRWIGILSNDIISNWSAEHRETHETGQSRGTEEILSQDSSIYSFDSEFQLCIQTMLGSVELSLLSRPA